MSYINLAVVLCCAMALPVRFVPVLQRPLAHIFGRTDSCSFFIDVTGCFLSLVPQRYAGFVCLVVVNVHPVHVNTDFELCLSVLFGAIPGFIVIFQVVR